MRVKDKPKDNSKSFNLTNEEFEYVKAMNNARQNIYEEQGRTTAAFLYYLAGTKFGYTAGQELQFELDFDNPKHELKITESMDH
jgi:hypothetical protein